MPIRDWKPALNRFMIEFEEELTPHIYTGQLHSLFYTLQRGCIGVC
jgi:hypothetical protein